MIPTIVPCGTHYWVGIDPNLSIVASKENYRPAGLRSAVLYFVSRQETVEEGSGLGIRI